MFDQLPPGARDADVQAYNAARDYYVYPIVFAAFTGVGQRSVNVIRIQTDAAFLWLMLTGTSVGDTTAVPTNGGQVNGGSLIEITDQGGQRALTDAPTPFSSICGSAQRPYILPTPHRFPRGGSINVAVTNQGTVGQIVRLEFHGMKLFL